MVEFLADLAVGGTALEFGVGTGRIALPLAQRGVKVHGIELSGAMAARMQAKPGGRSIGVTIGDFAATSVEVTFSVVYLVANTIMNLTTQDEQVKGAQTRFRSCCSLIVFVQQPPESIPPTHRCVKGKRRPL